MGKKITFIDLFAGCGGLTDGFLQSGKYEPLSHIEWDPKIALTLKQRLKNKWKISNKRLEDEVITFDLQKINELLYGNWTQETLEKFGKFNSKNVIKKGLSELINKKVDLIIGGPPCQAYSIAGRAQDSDSMKNDYRNYLFESFVKIVDYFKPSMFLFENVPGMLSAKPGNKPVTQRIYESFKAIGYSIKEPKTLHEAILDSSDFGVPQKRRRVIIIGINKKEYNHKVLDQIYDELKNIKISPIKTVKDTIFNYPKIYPIIKNELSQSPRVSHKFRNSTNSLPDHNPRFHNQRDINIFKDWVVKDMNRLSSADKIKFYNKRTGKISNHNKYRNLDWNKPSPTIVAHLYKDGLMFIHPDSKQTRSITVREAAALQSFDDDFKFTGKMGIDYKMIGNAVPPLMAKKISQILVKFLK